VGESLTPDAVSLTVDAACALFAEAASRRQWFKAEALIVSAIELAKLSGTFAELEEEVEQ
jgi:hypothetical protein